VLDSTYMEERTTYDIEDFLKKARERPHQNEEEPYHEATFRNYLRFSNLEENKDYYQQIKVLKAILNDIRSQSPFISKMEKYCPGISGLTVDDILKLRYNPEQESYVVYADENQYEIYEDDIRFIYPSITDVPDSYEYEVVIEDSSVYVYHRFATDPPFRVFGLAEAAEE
jgi:hypothetical protein